MRGEMSGPPAKAEEISTASTPCCACATAHVTDATVSRSSSASALPLSSSRLRSAFS
jgi:hypothetical protein